jgi:two-component sensor histidine kinase
VEAPTGPPGYGSKLITRVLETSLDGSIARDWAPEGAIITIRMDKKRLAL